MRDKKTHHIHKVGLLVTLIIVSLVALISWKLPSSGQLRTQIISPVTDTAEKPVVLIRHFNEPVFDIYYKALKSVAPSPVTISILQIQGAKSGPLRIESLPLTSADITPIVRNGMTPTVTAQSNAVVLVYTSLATQATTHLGSFSVNLQGAEYSSLQADINIGSLNYSLVDKAYPSDDVRLANNPFSNTTNSLVYINTPEGGRIIPPQTTLHTLTRLVNSYALLYPGELSNTYVERQTPQAPNQRVYPTSGLVHHTLTVPMPTVTFLNDQPLFNPAELARYNTIILKLSDRASSPASSYHLFSLGKKTPLQMSVPWRDLPDIYSNVEIAFAFLDRADAMNSTLIKEAMQTGTPGFASMNYLSPFTGIFPEIQANNQSAKSTITVSYGTLSEQLLAFVLPKKVETIAEALLALNTSKMPVTWNTETANTLNTQTQRNGTSLVLNVLTKQATVLSKTPITSANPFVIPQGLGIVTADPATNLNLPYYSTSEQAKRISCFVKPEQEWTSLPMEESDFISPLDCWREAEKRGIQSYDLRILTYTSSTDSLLLEPLVQAYTPSTAIPLSITSYNPNTKSGVFSAAVPISATITAVFSSDLTFAQQQEIAVTTQGTTFTLSADPNGCSGTCFFRLIYKSTENTRVYYQQIPGIIPHNSGKEMNLFFCYNNPNIASHSVINALSWKMATNTGQSVALAKDPVTKCLVYQKARQTTSTTAVTVGQTLYETQNLLTNGGFETDPDLDAGNAITNGGTTVITTDRWTIDPLLDWGGSHGRSGTSGIDYQRLGTTSVEATQAIAGIPGKKYKLTAWGKTLATAPTRWCRLTMEFLDQSAQRIGRENRNSFQQNNQFHAVSVEAQAPAGTSYIKVTLSTLETTTDESKACTFDDVELLKEAISTSGAANLQFGDLLSTNASSPEVPERSLLISNIPTTPTVQNYPFLTIANRSVPYQTNTIRSAAFSHQVQFITMQGERSILLDPFHMKSGTLPEIADTIRVTSVDASPVISPYNLGTSLYTSDISSSSLLNPLTYSLPPQLPYVTSATYSSGFLSSIPHVFHILTPNQVYTLPAIQRLSGTGLVFTQFPESTSSFSIASLFRPEVSVSPRVQGQPISITPDQKINLIAPSNTIGVPLNASFQITTSTSGIPNDIPIPGDLNTVSIRDTLFFTFANSLGISATTPTNPITLQTAVRATQYSAPLPFTTLINRQVTPYTLSNPIIPDSECLNILTLNIQTEQISGFIPQGIATLFCDASVELQIRETTGGIQHDATATAYLRVPINASPPFPEVLTSTFYVPKTGILTPISIRFTNGLSSILYNGAAADPTISGITATYNTTLKSIVITGQTTNLSADLTLLVSARDAITLNRIEQTIILKPTKPLQVLLGIVNNFRNELYLETEIAKAYVATLPATGRPAADTIRVQNFELSTATLPSAFNYLPDYRVLVLDPENTLTGSETFAASGIIESERYDFTFTLRKTDPTAVTLSPITVLEGTRFSLNIRRHLLQLNSQPAYGATQLTKPLAPYELDVTTPNWLRFDGKNSVTGWAPTFTNASITVKENTENKIYTLPLVGHAVPQPSTTATPRTTVTVTTGTATTSTTATTTTNTSTTTGTVTTSTTATITTTTADPHLSADCFSDLSGIPTNYSQAICKAKQQSIIEGVDGKFLPQNTINRAEASKILITGPIFKASLSTTDDLLKIQAAFQNLDFVTYPDILPRNWFMPYVIKATELQIVAGYPDGYFRPANVMNFAEAAKLMVNTVIVSGTETSAVYRTTNSCVLEGTPWYFPYVMSIKKYGGDFPDVHDSASLTQNIKRDQFVFNMMNLLSKTAETTAVLCEPTDTVPTTTATQETTTTSATTTTTTTTPTSTTAAPPQVQSPTTSTTSTSQ